MRILFDGFWWGRGPVSNRHLMISMVQTWSDLFPDDEIVVAVRRKDRDRLVGLPSGVTLVETTLTPHGISTMVELPFIARRARADLIFTHNFTPLFSPSVVFIHDLLFVTNPEWFTAKERLYFGLMTLTARRARAIVTSSQSEADRINTVLSRGPRATAIGLGLGDRLATLESRPAALASTDHFLLTVGRLNVRKNLAFACRAAVRSGAISPRFPLVIAGSVHGRTEDWPKEVLEAIQDGSVVLTGYVSDGELAWLYAQCRAFLFLSRGEGFGLPPLEALHAGAEIIASNIPVMREILDEHATFVEVTDSERLEREIARVVSTAPSAQERAAGIAWASGFTWERTIRLLRQTAVGASRSQGST